MRKFHKYVQFREEQDIDDSDPTYGFKVGDIVIGWGDKRCVVGSVGKQPFQHNSGKQTVELGLAEEGSSKYQKTIEELASGKGFADIGLMTYPAVQVKKESSKVIGNINDMNSQQIQQATGVVVNGNNNISASNSPTNKRLYHLDQKGDAFIFTPAE